MSVRARILKIEKKIKLIIRYLIYFGIFFAKERKFKVDLPFYKKLFAWRHGYLGTSFKQYNIDRTNYKTYISDYHRWMKLPLLNEGYGLILADKELFHDFMYPFSQFVPKIYFEIKKGKLLYNDLLGTKVCDLLDLVIEKKKLALKPKTSYGGIGFSFIESKGEKFLLGNQQLVTGTAVMEMVSGLDNYIITDFIQQADYAQKIFPAATNTIRVITMYDEELGGAFIAGAAHRFGTESTQPVDNWTQGGMSASIDLDTGVLGKCALNPKGEYLQWVNRHPNTEEIITGVQIPNWLYLKQHLLRIVKYVRFCPYIGWDIVITDEGFMVIEANDCPDIHIVQIHSSLIANEKAKLFFRKHKIIKI